jgi:hypothetical protein
MIRLCVIIEDSVFAGPVAEATIHIGGEAFSRGPYVNGRGRGRGPGKMLSGLIMDISSGAEAVALLLLGAGCESKVRDQTIGGMCLPRRPRDWHGGATAQPSGPGPLWTLPDLKANAAFARAGRLA